MLATHVLTHSHSTFQRESCCLFSCDTFQNETLKSANCLFCDNLLLGASVTVFISEHFFRYWSRKVNWIFFFRFVCFFIFSSEALRSYHGNWLHSVPALRWKSDFILFFLLVRFSLISSLPSMRFNRQTSISINFPAFRRSNSAECHYHFRNSWLANMFRSGGS